TSFEPSSSPISTESSRCASALPRISALGFAIEPNLYSCAWKRFGLIEPAFTPNLLSSRLISGTSPLPFGRSQSTCSATVGLAPVSLLTCAASANFSSSVVAAPACENLPNLVPVLAKPHEGTSIRNPSSARKTRSVALAPAPAPFTPITTPQKLQLRKYTPY